MEAHSLNLLSQGVEVLHCESVQVLRDFLQFVLYHAVIHIDFLVLAELAMEVVFGICSEEVVGVECIEAGVVVKFIHFELEDLFILN